ncbi:hypothetical protein SUGI_0192650 [Cryptomeria japonica]|uniref:uncharacterized protein LOC131055686 n=1 Tax=Cryptomeria japonica TaxID=3369 RepID=UPI002408BF81|nr:uncharacterized protein LOC131055686 [Cryptomeria japonica]GLJ12521.1 hypothetical protein SUGI_0192650 [Cryptomeria japonica]
MKRAKECCMCGDTGFSHELFQCTACLYRSQHTYCSCMYPKAESYHVCDWCLRGGEERKASKQIMEKCTQSDLKKSGSFLPGLHAIKKHKPALPDTAHVQIGNTHKFGDEGNHEQMVEPAKNGILSSVKKGISKCKEIFGSKAVTTADSKASTPRLVKGKVRRYKLLEEVST